MSDLYEGVDAIQHDFIFEDVAGSVSWVRLMDGRVFTIGTPVVKKDGYAFPGIINVMFTTPERRLRAVVWCSSDDCKGMLHIFNLEQLEPV